MLFCLFGQISRLIGSSSEMPLFGRKVEVDGAETVAVSAGVGRENRVCGADCFLREKQLLSSVFCFVFYAQKCTEFPYNFLLKNGGIKW